MSGAINNPYAVTPPTDTTLSVEGAAADAKETGDALNKRMHYPAYANVDVLGSAGTFTINNNGFFQLRASTDGATEASIFHRITVNGWTVDEGYTASRNYTYYSSPLIPVMAGDVVNVTGGTAKVTYKAYLYKIRK